jgi:hypothetical protein
MGKSIFVSLLCLLSTLGVSNANTLSNKFYNIELTVSDSCVVQFLNEDSSMVSITSPDKKSIFYFIGIHTNSGDNVYTNDLFDSFDGDCFEALKREPDETKSSFFFSKEDHFYTLEDSTLCHTRTYLWNSKAGLLAGFSANGDMEFINQCMDSFKSSRTLGYIGTFLYGIIFVIVIIVLFVAWEEKRLLGILLICIVVAIFYYFHWVLDISINKYFASFFG